ncbi:hypothetical protein C1H46_019192 [Malus baccata]|uniref:Uncharacterized protein n=1 Tax=Malus baccata TaxID=106549 RepID=A0A540M956_MALBA|nr:hypothetical protein C1H46_019192 [Malus baccata]
MLRELSMSQLIRSRKAVMTALRSIPPPPTSATTAPAEMDPRLVNLIHLVDPVSPRVSQVPTSLAYSVALPISAKYGHCRPRTPNTTSVSTTDASGSQQGFGNCYNFRGDSSEISLKTTKVTWVTNRRITIGYDDRHWDAPTPEQHNALAHDIGHVIQTYCPMQWKSWKAMPDKVRTKVRAYLSFQRHPLSSLSWRSSSPSSPPSAPPRSLWLPTQPPMPHPSPPRSYPPSSPPSLLWPSDLGSGFEVAVAACLDVAV